ncbi:NrsF family protein (plasmid) [Skermanella mucosa]|uniref:NrsF family protein n=1 Tax=Skermanella mucosa TaxID=1789672 RepID=UPI00192C5CB5|nr:NrsF family protein [Skermanella mucosa]UEM25182.1 NrsF family protein [Skermanella mucosa]
MRTDDLILRLFHAQDASLMVLFWQFGTVALLTAMPCAAGRRILRWRHAASA